MQPASIQDELWRKALDQIAHLQAAHEDDRISAESFKVGVETIWAVLGGVVDTKDFQDLMHEANQEVSTLRIEPRIRVLQKDDRLVMIERRGECIKLHAGRVPSHQEKTFGMEGDAIEFAKQTEQDVISKGFARTI